MQESNLDQNPPVNSNQQPAQPVENKTEAQVSPSTKSKLPMILIVIFIFLVILGSSAYLLKNSNLKNLRQSRTNPPASQRGEQLKSQNLIPTQTTILSPIPTEIIDIDSQDNPDLGLAGYSSGSVKAGDQEIQLRLLAPDRKKVILSSFPCETRQVTAVEGTFRIIALVNMNGPVIDRYFLGQRDFVIKPAEIEQTGRFTKLVTLNDNPTYQAFTLAFRKSCYDTQVYFFGFDDKKQKIIWIPFIKKDGTKTDFILVPKEDEIPQIDNDGNVISSSYNEKTKWRDKTRYKFNLETFEFKEIESYSQEK